MSDEDRQRHSSGLDALARAVLTDDANLGDALRRVAATGCGLLTNCASVSVAIIERGRAITVGSTSDTAQALDDAQYTAGDGPCLSAARDRVLVRIDDAGSEQRWPDFCRRAVEHDVHSSLSLPLSLSGDDTWGGFNVYGSVVAGFSDDACRSLTWPCAIGTCSAGSAPTTAPGPKRARHRPATITSAVPWRISQVWRAGAAPCVRIVPLASSIR
jgi:GAF domain